MEQSLVYIVDDDPDMRDSLRWLMKTVGIRAETFASATEFLRDFTPNGPGCVILDVRMPGTSGLDLFEQLVARGEGMPVIFITAHADVPMAVRAMKSGAVEFVEKPFNRQTLLDKVQRASRMTASAAGGWPRARSSGRFRRLTDKEREVLELIKEGRPNKEIASQLQITPRAVELRRSSLMRKLGVRSLIELLRLAVVRETGLEDVGIRAETMSGRRPAAWRSSAADDAPPSNERIPRVRRPQPPPACLDRRHTRLTLGRTLNLESMRLTLRFCAGATGNRNEPSCFRSDSPRPGVLRRIPARALLSPALRGRRPAPLPPAALRPPSINRAIEAPSAIPRPDPDVVPERVS